MELGTIIGFTLGIFFVVFSILLSAGWQAADVLLFVNGPAVMITIGGTVAATFMGVKFEKLIVSIKAIGIIFSPPVLDPVDVVDKIVTLANTARKEGVLALEDSAEVMEDPFLQKGIMLVVDGTDEELVRNIMENELACIDERHGDIAATYEFIGGQAPAWGMVGTLISLILMLPNLQEPSQIGSKMGIALVTTFYGSILANLFANPIANKMKQISREEILLKTVIIEGVLAIQAGENPRVIEEKLKSFLAPVMRKTVGVEARRRDEEYV